MCYAKIDILDIIEKEFTEVEYDNNLFDMKSKDGQPSVKGSIKLKYKWVPSKYSESIINPYIREPEKMVEGKLFVKIVNGRQLKEKANTIVYWLSNDEKKTKK